MTQTERSEYYLTGFDRGQAIASWIDIPENLDNCAEWCNACESDLARYHCHMSSIASESESIDRDYSPFEITASEINSLEESESEAAWNDFDEGINDGIDANITPRLKTYFNLVDSDGKDTQYNGWKNFETWNVALWLGSDYPLYCVSQGFKKYATPYLSLRKELRDSLGYAITKDRVSLWDKALDIPALDEMLREE